MCTAVEHIRRGKTAVFWRSVPFFDAIKSFTESTTYTISSWWYKFRGQSTPYLLKVGGGLSPSEILHRYDYIHQ